jgi:hypothetical protein
MRSTFRFITANCNLYAFGYKYPVGEAAIRSLSASAAKASLFFGGVGGDDHALDTVVGLLGEDAAGGELILGGVGAAVDNAFGVGVADAGQGFDLFGRGGVDVERTGGSGGGLGCLGCAGQNGEGGDESEKEGEGEKSTAKIEHGRLLSLGYAFMRKGTRAEEARQYAMFCRDIEMFGGFLWGAG